ncbi:RagB/SusD family nutrient uptake outer membrane protein [Pontibacter anaerobius]|uniref:RagB/SusD family nutrient uptake outer membrane protein n=1 Tax=Pontibacter anaerobius TaxID=2993940 RepID=A0ABT3RC86_9BACT|nr:RagB/SusD family nutrient uptake outer membrane protein [Pontibacter anaerobius]MCX2738895.1 RagB/SusD family nutrient uptake outer membrane protein [Pontibacter anaerobius]
MNIYRRFIEAAEKLKRKTAKENYTLRLAYLAGVLCLAGAMSSCEVLDQEPQAEVSEDIAISNKKGAQAALAGLYDQLQSGNYYGSNLLIMGDISSDVAQSIGTWDFYREMDTYLIDKSNLETGNFWTRAYRAINVANNIIEQVPPLADITEEEKNKIIGQAYLVRGLAYFDLTKVFGGVPGVVGTLGVPIITKPSRKVDESFFPSRASLEESYGQVESDLLTALEMLPEAHQTDLLTRSQAVKGTARALLSRLYLYLGKPEQAITYADAIIADPKYSLVASFANIFSSKFTTEAIFELNFNSADQSGINNWYYPSSLGGRGDIMAHTSFYEEATADPNDVRGKMFGYYQSKDVHYPTKYGKTSAIDNIQIIRLGEVYLNRAEARAKTGDVDGALADLNTIRQRAGIAPIEGLTDAQEALRAIWHERKLELAFEGHSFFDLVRTGQALNELTGIPRTNGPDVNLADPARQVFPIPAFDMDANKNLVQNEAYK